MITQRELGQVAHLRALHSQLLFLVRESLKVLEETELALLKRLLQGEVQESGHYTAYVKEHERLHRINWQKEFRERFPEFYKTIKESVGRGKFLELSLKDNGVELGKGGFYGEDEISGT